MTTFTFTDRTSYLAYRNAWKVQYKSLTKAIRDVKFLRYWHQRLGTANAHLPWGSHKELEDILPDTPRLNARILAIAARPPHLPYPETGLDVPYNIRSLPKYATAMLENLKLAKVEAQRQYLSQKEAALTINARLANSQPEHMESQLKSA